MDQTIPIGAPAPGFCLPDLDGQEHCLEAWRGQIVIVNFWSAECPWVAEADRLLLEYLPDWQDAVILAPVAANQNESPAQLRQIATERGLPRLLVDRQAVTVDRFRAKTTPHVFVIDPQGILRYQGAFNDRTFRRRRVTRAYLRQAVDALLAGYSPDPTETQPYGCTIVRLGEERG